MFCYTHARLRSNSRPTGMEKIAPRTFLVGVALTDEKHKPFWRCPVKPMKKISTQIATTAAELVPFHSSFSFSCVAVLALNKALNLLAEIAHHANTE